VGQNVLSWVYGPAPTDSQTRPSQPWSGGKQDSAYLLHNACQAGSAKVDVVIRGTSVKALLTYCCRPPRDPWWKSHAGSDLTRLVIAYWFCFDGLTAKKLDLVTKTQDGSVLLLQRFRLEDRLPFTLRKIVMTVISYLMKRTGGTWLYAVTL